MVLNEYLKTLAKNSTDQKDVVAEFALRCGTSVGQLRQVARGYRRAGESLAINIERESQGQIRCETLRPDVDWAYIRNSNHQAA